jgi:hypothetical protein
LGIVGAMSLEEHTLEELSDHCEECGAPLTAEELAAALESGGPALCTVHAAEVLALEDDEVDA